MWTYSNLIRCLADSRLWRRAVGILDDMLEEGGGGVEPDAHCFNAAIRACSKVQNRLLALRQRLSRRERDFFFFCVVFPAEKRT